MRREPHFSYAKGAFMDSFLELACARYSERRFSQRPVEEEVLREILEAGRIAPSAHNTRCFRFFVLRSAEALAKVRALTPMTYGAPVAVIVGYDAGLVWGKPEDTYYENYNSGEVDCAIALSSMMFAAADLGVASLWARDYLTAELVEAFGIPENVKPVGIMSFGYASEESAPSPNHFKRDELESMTVWL